MYRFIKQAINFDVKKRTILDLKSLIQKLYNEAHNLYIVYYKI